METIIILWLLGTLLIGYIGKSREIGFDNAMLWSFLLSPIIGLIITLSSKKKESKSDNTTEEDKHDKKISDNNKVHDNDENHFLREKYEKMLYAPEEFLEDIRREREVLMSIYKKRNVEYDMTPDEMISLRDKIGISDDNYTIISKMIASYYMELNSPKYEDRFDNMIALFTTVGVLDAQIYVFQERSISIKEIKELAIKSFKEENPLLEFTIEMGIKICKIDAPEIPDYETENAWRNLMHNDVLQTISFILNNYPLRTNEEKVVKNHTEMFMNVPQTIEFRKEIGILN